MILSQPDLIAAWRKKLIRFSPDISEDQIGLSSIDLRLGYIITRLKKSGTVIKPAAKGFDPTLLVQNIDLRRKRTHGKPAPFRLSPGQLMLAFTLESKSLPHLPLTSKARAVSHVQEQQSTLLRRIFIQDSGATSRSKCIITGLGN